MPYTEGCLSVPDQYAEVMRPDRIRARWLDEQGKAHEEELDGLLAVCLQHEMDHLEGILFIDHLSQLKRDMVLKKLAKPRKEQRALTGGLMSDGDAPYHAHIYYSADGAAGRRAHCATISRLDPARSCSSAR